MTPPANHTVNGNADAADALLTVENLSVHFIRSGGLARRGLVVRAVDGVSFRVRGGATFGIVGESGSGKSTLARALLGLIRASAGRVLFDGVNVLAARRGPLMRLRRRMQIVFQDPQASLNPRLPVKTIVGEALHVHGLARTGREAAERVADVLRAVGLSPDDMHRYPQQFSGGQRQRIGIARALALDPDLIICDEAVAALDVSIQAQVLNLLRDLQRQRGLTYLFISHDIEVVRAFCDEVAVMRDGRFVEQGAVSILDQPAHPYTKALIQAADLS